jgi:hypothetical protein
MEGVEMIDRNKLRKAAEAATPGPWKLYSALHYHEVQCAEKVPVVSWPGFDDCDRTIKQHKANAKFIVLANPQTVLALLDALEAAEEQIKLLKECKNGL